jgi:hypothetical protein
MTHLLDTNICSAHMRRPDMMIASVALVHDLTLVTHNTTDFRHIPGLRTTGWSREVCRRPPVSWTPIAKASSPSLHPAERVSAAVSAPEDGLVDRWCRILVPRFPAVGSARRRGLSHRPCGRLADDLLASPRDVAWRIPHG